MSEQNESHKNIERVQEDNTAENEDNTGRNDRNRGQENEVSLILNESESSMDLSLPPGHAFASFSS